MSTIEQLAESIAATGWAVEITADGRVLVGDAWDNLSVTFRDGHFIVRQGWLELAAVPSMEDVSTLVSTR